MFFLERIYDNVLRYPGREVLSDSGGDYTNAELWDVSSRTYSYLSRQGIGREDIVLINLPRGVEAVMVLLGVLRAGAAAVILETEGRAEWKENVDSIIPRTVIDSSVMETVRSLSPLEGFRIPDLHDLAYIAFTTGSTGCQKAVMQEYGTIQSAVESGIAMLETYDLVSDRLAYVTSLHTVIPLLMMYISINSYSDIVPYEAFKTDGAFLTHLIEKKISYTYLSSVYLHRYGVPDSPYLKYVSVSFEPLNGFYSDKVAIYNDYGSRETGISVCEFRVDRIYPITPIGKPLPGCTVTILDDAGREVRDGELGEICVVNRFCRGYLNQPELTAQQFRDGYFHTRDLGMRLSDGNFIMYGRTCDALPTEKGLIIALEIEIEARRILGIYDLYVKVFPSEPAPVICLYSESDIDFPRLRSELGKILPDYKLPTDWVKVDSFQYRNGKAIRAHLHNPRQ